MMKDKQEILSFEKLESYIGEGCNGQFLLTFIRKVLIQLCDFRGCSSWCH